ncbi:hypothetical protein HHI36_005978 [Cryptolaemus montrouzieri]|uniref:Retinol dehydrogenase 12 n=1 Tax=Cryptolaemus montrouzieri TaxID=559131 RepID=A0ABD2NVW6_9CUCU
MGIFSAKCMSKVRLDGKTAIVTGCNTGIGKETAKDFFQRGAKVIMACRNVASANQAAEDIKRRSENSIPGELQVVELDLSSLESVRRCAGELIEKEDRIDILVNNAGLMMSPYTKTKDGYELQFATNHLGHFLFTLLLLPKMVQSRPARIVTVSSRLHEGGEIDFNDLNSSNKTYNALKAYRQSKLANILFTKELARRLAENDITNLNTYSLHPGVIASDLSRHLNGIMPGVRRIYDFLTRLFSKNVEQGAQTSIYCAVDEGCEKETGLYYAECRVKQPSCAAKNAEDARKLFDVSWELVGLDNSYDPFYLKSGK